MTPSGMCKVHFAAIVTSILPFTGFDLVGSGADLRQFRAYCLRLATNIYCYRFSNEHNSTYTPGRGANPW